MFTPNLFILYVDNPLQSAHFYSNLFDSSPIESSETFVMFSFDIADSI